MRNSSWSLLFCVLLTLGLSFKALARECTKTQLSEIQKSAEQLLPRAAILHGEGHFLQHLNHLPGQSGEKRVAAILRPHSLEETDSPEVLGIMLSPFDLQGHLTPIRTPLNLAAFRPGVILKESRFNCLWDTKEQTLRWKLPTFTRVGMTWKLIEITFENLSEKDPLLPQKLSFHWPEHSRRYVLHYNQWMHISKDQWFANKMRLESFLLRNGNRSETAKINWSRIKPWISRDLLKELKSEKENSQFQIYDQVLLPKYLKTQYSKNFIKKLEDEIERPFPPFSNERMPEIIHL